MDFRRADLRYAQDARGRDRSVQPSPQPGPHCSVPRVLFPFKDLYSLCTLLNIPLYRFRFCCIGETKTYSVVQERGRWITKTAFLTEPTPMVSITRCKSSHKLKNLCSKGKPHWFFARISLTVVGLAASSFWVSCERCINKGISVKISFFVQYYSQFRSNWWNSECSVEEGMLLRKSRHKCCFCLREFYLCWE